MSDVGPTFFCSRLQDSPHCHPHTPKDSLEAEMTQGFQN